MTNARVAAASIRAIQNIHEHALDAQLYDPWFPRRILVGADEVHYSHQDLSLVMHPWDAMHMVRSYASKHLRSRGFTELPSGSWAFGHTDNPEILPSLLHALRYDAGYRGDETPTEHPNVQWQVTST
jgi:hypothetical protein